MLVNLWLTTKDSLGNFTRSVPGKFVFAGSVWYLITCIQGPIQSLPSVQRYTHFNNWVIGHAHIAVLGFSGMIALGGLWYVLPLVTGRRVYSMNLANLQFWLISVGLLGFFVVLTIAGLIQGAAWISGETIYRALPLIAPYMGLRLASGVLIIIGAFIGLYNVVMTLVPRGAAPGMRMNPSVLIFGSLAVIWAAFLAVVVMPTKTISQQPSDTWRPLGERERKGRLLYIANGCTYCHSQYVRPQDWDVGAERIAQPGDYKGQEPHLLGSERTGSDLSEEGESTPTTGILPTS